ncbi:MAG TPA: response regulator [Chloroflexota bacterium]|nr:response regulator [Chloroflexota bacterium]
MRILVIEDEALVALQIELSLEAADHEVAGQADTLRAAIKLAEEEHPDLALVDVRLAEGCSGLDVAAELKKRGVPSLFVTGNCPGENRSDIALGCLHKPFTQTQIIRAVGAAECLLRGERPNVKTGELHFY